MKKFLAIVIITTNLFMLFQISSASAPAITDNIVNLDQSPLQILTVEQTIAAILSNMGLDKNGDNTSSLKVVDINGSIPSAFAQNSVDIAVKNKALPSAIPSFTANASKLFAMKVILASVNYSVWEEAADPDDKLALESMLLDFAASSGVSKKETGMAGLDTNITKADLKSLIKRWKIKELGNDTMKSGWALYGARNLKAAICVFKRNVDAGLHTGTLKIYYANCNYGLGLSYAHNDIQRYVLASQYLNAAIKYDPDGAVGKNAKTFIDTKLTPVQLDYQYMPDKILTYEEAMAMIGRYMWLDTKDAQDVKALDKSGQEASDWTLPYVRAAFKRNYMSYVPSSFKAVAPRYWIAEYLMNVKGYQQYEYEKFYDFNDTRDLPVDARMFISVAVERGIMSGIKPGIFDPLSGITRKDVAVIINAMKNPRTPEKSAAQKDDAHKVVQTYYANLGYDSCAAQNEIISRRGASINMINFDCVNMGQGNLQEGTACISTTLSNKNLQDGLASAKQAGVKCFLLLHNYNNGVIDGDFAHKFIKDDASRLALVNDLAILSRLYGFQGVHVDFEHLALSDKKNYSSFLAQLSSRMKRDGKLLTVAVGAYFTDQSASVSEFDYEKISRYADYVNIILYDDFSKASYPKSGLDGPISNIIRIERVLKYATILMPTSKILLGVGAYGIDFNLDKKSAVNLPLPGIGTNVNSGQKDSVKYLYDTKSEAPYIEYTSTTGEKHRIWYENAKSMNKRFDMVHKYHLAGISFYWLGSESNDFYDGINHYLNK